MNTPTLKIFDDRKTIYAGADYLHGVRVRDGHTLAAGDGPRRVVAVMRPRRGHRLIRLANTTTSQPAPSDS